MGFLSSLLSPDGLRRLIITIPCVLITLTFHEFAHGITAKKLGDNTAASLGRLTLNPLKHLDLIGTICMIIFGFGWAKPVPIRPRNFKNPRTGMAITAAAGPLMNLLLALISAFIAELCANLFLLHPAQTELALSVQMTTIDFILTFHILNVALALFNLIPLPPLDGSRIAYIFLPTKWYFGVMKYEQYIKIGFLALLWASTFLNLPLLSPLIAAEEWVSNGMLWLAGKFFALFFH